MGRTPKTRTLQDREAWAMAAWESMAETGDVTFAVERLATALGVTKGSFYWHFTDRRDLLREVLATFERKGAKEPIDHLNEVRDPRRRVALLFETAFGQTGDLRSERSLYASADPDVRATVERVHTMRRAFLDRAYRQMGFSPAVAARWGATTYATYLGAVQLSDQPPFDDDRTLRAWMRHLSERLVPALGMESEGS